MSRSQLDGLLKILDNAKAEKVWVYDVVEHVSYTDHVIILTALSNSHVKLLITKSEEYLKEQKLSPFTHTRKQDNYQWVVLDYSSIIIHLFQNDEREFYQLDQYFQKLLPSEKYHPYPYA